MFFTSLLLAAGDDASLREFLAHSLLGATLTDDALREAFRTAWNGWQFSSWKSDDGHFHSKFETYLLMVRGLQALLEDDTDATRDALREWLPSAAELLRITEYECAWRANSYGANHPALLCARLHGERRRQTHISSPRYRAAGLVACETRR